MATRAVDVVERVTPKIGLPRITARYDESGVPEIFGVKTTTIARLIPGVNLGFAELPPDTLQELMNKNIQHVELEVNDAGVFIYMNGNALPYLAWSEDRLRSIGELIDRTDAVPYDTTIAKAMPLLGRIGIDVVAAFPVPSGTEEIPIRDRDQRTLAEVVSIEEPTATFQATITYSDEGVPSVADITTREVGDLAQMDLSSVELTEANMQLIKTAGIQKVAIVTETDGLHIVVNDQALLHLAYNEQHLTNAIQAYVQFSGDQVDEELTILMNNLIPIIQGADVDLVIQFPTGG